jgi:tRNA (guanine-N7-)-methyltransferase
MQQGPHSTELEHWKPRSFRRQAVPAPHNGIPENLKSRSFYLEIGSGGGHHAVSFAQSHPNDHLVAIERTKNRSLKARRHLDRTLNHGVISPKEELPNLTLLRDDAVHWAAAHVRPQCLEGIFLLYPNPYPKYSQRNKRFPFMPFMSVLSEGLRDHATLTLASNEPWYILDALSILPRHFCLDPLVKRVCDPRHPPRTTFETHFFSLGILCYEVVFTRRPRHALQQF